MSIKIAHLTSHHEPFDNRIFARECRSLAAAGYEVVLVCQHDRDEQRDGVQILAVPRYRNRLERFTRTAWRVFRRGLATDARVYHFHDPELIVWGLVLRLLGRTVVYDVHEDFAQAAAGRSWVPGPLRPVLGALYTGLAGLSRRLFRVVIAERCYAGTFPDGLPVLNYPRAERFAALAALDRSLPPDRLRLLYTGNVFASRGAYAHVALLRHLPGAELVLLGKCDPALGAELRGLAGPGARLTLDDSGAWIPHDRILAAYGESWTVGLALFPDDPEYHEKELTKLFEYMAAGIPIIGSDFPVWRALIEGTGAGICLPPEDAAGAAAAIRALAADPARARAMGEAGRRAVRDRFNWETQVPGLLRLYAELAGSPA